MNDVEAMKLAEPVVKAVVNCIAEKRYSDITEYARLKVMSLTDFEELVEGYLEINELSYIDKYGVTCSFHPKYEYHQLSCIVYKNGNGFHADYDFTTDGELNDLTLQMEFLITEEGMLVAEILDAHVL